jgi:hypothetical protein
MIFTYEDKEKLKEDIILLTPNDWWNIYRDIIKKNNEPHTINNSGLFFDLINVSNESLTMIKQYIDNIKQN